MPDFQAAVRRRLGRLPLAPERAEEILLELTHQVEDAFREALARGVAAAQAEENAMAQLGNPEELRRSIVSSERGEKVLWPHSWAVPRAACFLALAIFLALGLVPSFRQALDASAGAYGFSSHLFSREKLQALAERGVKNHDARLIAFSALHLEDEFAASQFAEQAIALDPSLTWVGTRFIAADRSPKDARVNHEAWAKRVIAWDPENAVPRLLASEALYRGAIPDGSLGPAYDPQIARLAETTPWAEQMRAAFEAPRYDAYNQRRFELVVGVLNSLGTTGTEPMVWDSARALLIPDFTQIQRYAALVTGKLGPDEERAGRFEQAAKLYWSVARFGEHMEEGSEWVWERTYAWRLQASAYASLATLAERRGNAEEKAAYLLLSEHAEKARAAAISMHEQTMRTRWESAGRAAIVAWCSAWAMLLSALGCVAWVALAGFRGEARMLGGWQGALALGTSYAPGMLLAASAVFYCTALPYLHGASAFSNSQTIFTEMAPFWFSFWTDWGPLTDWRFYAQRLAWPALLSAAVLLLGIALLQRMARLRAARAVQTR